MRFRGSIDTSVEWVSFCSFSVHKVFWTAGVMSPIEISESGLILCTCGSCAVLSAADHNGVRGPFADSNIVGVGLRRPAVRIRSCGVLYV